MKYNAGKYDVAVIGAGHAGCEAALATARLGLKTLLFSISLEAVANMPCNPHIGGSSKGHLVMEIDCLGGEMGKNIDKTYTQLRMLNTSKGPAVYSLRAQADRKKYQMEMKHTLEKQPNLYLKQAEIVDIGVEDGKVKSVEFLFFKEPFLSVDEIERLEEAFLNYTFDLKVYGDKQDSNLYKFAIACFFSKL